MEEKIIEIIADLIKKPLDYLQLNQTEKKLWNSMQLVEIVLALEEEFDVMLYPEDIEEMKDIQNVINVIKGKEA